MKFSIKRDILLKSLTLAQGIIEKKNTLPILSNVLLEVKNSKLSIIATDLDLVFYDEISEVNIEKICDTILYFIYCYNFCLVKHIFKDIFTVINGQCFLMYSAKCNNSI